MAAITPLRPYMPKDSVTLGLDAAGRSATVGLVVAAVQNTLAKHSQGAMGVVTRSGGVIAMFGKLNHRHSLVSDDAGNRVGMKGESRFADKVT